MRRTEPILVRERKAADIMAMSLSEFRGLVSVGALPGPIDIHGLVRWRYADLNAVAIGEAMDEGFEV